MYPYTAPNYGPLPTPPDPHLKVRTELRKLALEQAIHLHGMTDGNATRVLELAELLHDWLAKEIRSE